MTETRHDHGLLQPFLYRLPETPRPAREYDDPVPNIYLTPREKEILTIVAEGKSDRGYRVLLKLTPHGVDFHMRNIYKKMQTNSRTYAASKAIDLGLIHPLLHPYIRV